MGILILALTILYDHSDHFSRDAFKRSIQFIIMYRDRSDVSDPSVRKPWRDHWCYPIDRITFPFLSQGGSSLLMLSICIGFVLNISADEKRKSLGIY